jgi:hypothetical protein
VANPFVETIASADPERRNQAFTALAAGLSPRDLLAA